MENFLTDEDKKILRRNCRYLGSIGMDLATVEIDMSNGEIEYEDIEWDYITNYSNNFSAEILPAVLIVIKKIFEIASNRGPFEALDENGNSIEYNYYEIAELTIDCKHSEISLVYSYGFYGDGDNRYTEYDNEDGYYNEIFNSLEESNSWEDNSVIGLVYDGGGDSGYLEGTFTNGQSVPQVVESWCEVEISRKYPGWENNEGARGEFIFNKVENTITLEHTYREEANGVVPIFRESFK